jgi:hypothetical protein
MVNRNLAHFTLVILSAGLVLSAQDSLPVRKIPLGGAVRIVDVLRPGDRIVTLDARIRLDDVETFPLSVDDELYGLATQQEVAVFRVLESRSFLVRDGKWVRTRITASVERALRHNSQIPWGDQPDRLILEFDNGEIELQGVIVKAGRYPAFTAGTRYLGVLTYDHVNKSWELARGFRVDEDNKLARFGV